MKSASITVKLPEPVKNRLDRLAKATHRSRSSLVSSAVEEMLSVEEWQVQGIKEAIHEADSCNMIAHEEIKLEWEARNTPGKILLVEDLWDSIAAEEASVPISKGHKMELDRRLEKYASAPGTLLSLDDLRSRIEQIK